MEVALEEAPCPLGCEDETEFLFMAHDLLHDLSVDYAVVRCTHCGLMWTNPRPTAETMDYYYPDDYGPYIGTRVQHDLPARRRLPLLRSLARKMLELNIQRMPDMEPGRVLEIGCASGAFLQQMRSRGWEVAGIEFSHAAAEHARAAGFNVHAGTLEDAPEPQNSYDLVVGWMVLEHLHKPVLALQKLKNWTTPGARLVLSVPNAGSADFRWFRQYGYALHMPNHLYHYTPETLEKVLRAGGWKLEKVHHQRLLSNWFGGLGQVLYHKGHDNGLVTWLRSYPRKAGKLHYLFFPLALLLAAFGQTGRMTVWARRSDD
ncbi:class I SAM-dependent methyltransferase [Thiolapillus sp.]